MAGEKASQEKNTAKVVHPSDLFQKLYEFILLNIKMVSGSSDELDAEYEKYIRDNIHLMDPMFFSAGDDFMGQVFEQTKPYATDFVKNEFMKRWNAVKTYSLKIFEFVSLQINLIVKKDPETDQKLWLDFVLQHSQAINSDFLTLSKKMFLHYVNLSIQIQKDKESIIQKWDQIVDVIINLKKKSETAPGEEPENKKDTESDTKPQKEK